MCFHRPEHNSGRWKLWSFLFELVKREPEGNSMLIFIKKHAVSIARIGAAFAVLVFCAVMLFHQPAFIPDDPIAPGKVPSAEKMVASLEVDDLDMSTVSDGTSGKNNTDSNQKKDTSKDNQNTEKTDQKDPQNNQDGAEDNGQDNNGNGKNDSKNGEEGAPSVPQEDPNATGGNDTGITDNDDPTNQEGDGNTGEETLLPTPSTDKPVIVTDLNEYDNPRVAAFSEIPGGELRFYAYIKHSKEGMSLRVKLTNKETPSYGKYLTASGGRYYLATLQNGKNSITLYMMKDGSVDYHITYTIKYVPDKATAGNPSVGEHPPVITAYGTSGINNFSESIKVPNYVFRVQAEDYKGNYLSYDNIQVECVPEVGDRKLLKHPTGGGVYEYDIFFEPPVSGDTYPAAVNITAWDDEGNSSFRSYTLTYADVGEDQVIGTCAVYIDMTTIGFGIEYSGFEYEVRKGDTAADCVIAALEEYGLTPEYSGTIDENFYLRGLTAGFLTRGARIPDMLKDLLVLDGLPPTNGHSNDRLYEFDFTRGSGWMYTIDGVNYPGRGMDKYKLTGNETITLRFTLAYGKDLGQRSTAGGTLLSRYCGSWYNGEYHPNHQYENGGGEVIPGENCEEGSKMKCWRCKICGKYFMSDDNESVPVGYENQVVDSPYIMLPPGEHQWEEVKRIEASIEADGEIDYKCKVCGAEKQEIIPKLPDDGGGRDEGGGQQ